MTSNKLNMYMFLVLMFLSILMFIMSINMIMYEYSLMMEWNIMSINSCNMLMTLIFDFMSTMFLSTVMFISSMVILYSGEYMSSDKTINRFIYIVMMFVISMMMLIISPNMISIIIGWDGLGLVSYCLVIYYQNTSSNNAGMLTALMNRIGDVAILMSIAWMMNFGSWNFCSFIDKMDMNHMSMLIVLAGFTKSAQIPFSSWLPAAMAAPTPVSALVHSSTLVTAGVYLMIRFSNMIQDMSLINMFMLLSVMTMIMSGIGANLEFDLKKIIALSTLSQLGIMMMILMFGFPMLSFFHLIIHALFKASLFLCAGMIIHGFNNNQDIRMMGCLCYQMPMTMTLMNIANLSLCGIPFMSGFYSKDLIMESMCFNNINFAIMTLMYIGIGLTSFYSMRLSFFLMLTNHNYNSFTSLSETFNNMVKSVLTLNIYSIISGSMFMWLMFNQTHILLLSVEAKLMTLILSLYGIWMGYELSMILNSKNSLTKEFSGSMWFMKQISTFHNQAIMLKSSLMFQKSIDQGWGEDYEAQGIINLLNKMKTFNIKITENNFKIQMVSFLFWMMIIYLI
uniref:NADH-ubiquinone oxidoreductase chain 5 n=1 Tax=Tettigades lacertosa TaxID=1986886 RepID=A0A3S5GL55_9HEMI|nr:NADH dehydrogenase subunit 5 [Tettigades lacertosa]AWV83946.1 NADH dehydrogenase subunit 5 [Tettigades lacertosa]AWV83972.1 NADH dehydrogenase subunit 5 [Tettigades lacertosa]AWV83985.1 NADH dehydrogenase subunit 5 [Tettigades lacertosa]AWV83998.1 NADH dehydrogenase subunit 5 [Tettigades lacertosa]